jgi:hypothetical protein
MTSYDKLLSILTRLDDARIKYDLGHYRPDAVTISLAVPGERWEIEVLGDGEVEVEVFRSDGTIFDENKIGDLFRLHEREEPNNPKQAG